MKKLLILLAFAFLFLSLTSASSFDERKNISLIITPKPVQTTNIGEITISRQQWDLF